ncbi:MAG: DNA-directed RNA polymerase subunit alpha C-terminal domain-containing protein [bacterium]
MEHEVLILRLRELAEWAEANQWDVPLSLADNLREAADALEKLTNPMTIDELGLSTRAYGGLWRWNIRLVREVANLSAEDLAKIPGIGRGTAQEIIEKVKEVYGK